MSQNYFTPLYVEINTLIFINTMNTTDETDGKYFIKYLEHIF